MGNDGDGDGEMKELEQMSELEQLKACDHKWEIIPHETIRGLGAVC